jgi:hypothetical protein
MRRYPLLAAGLLLAGCSGSDSTSIGYWRGGEPLGGPSNGQQPQMSTSNANGGSGGAGGSPGTPAPTPTSAPTATTPPVPTSSPPAAPGSFMLTLDKSTASVNLLAQATFTVSVAPSNFTGAVALSVTGLPVGVTPAFDSSSLTLDGTSTATAHLTLTTASSTAPGDSTFQVVAAGGTTSVNVSSTLTVASDLTITIPMGVDNNGGTTSSPVMDAFGSYPINITAPADISTASPVTIHFYNGDDVSHEIHASSPGAGFPHGSGEFAPGTMEPTQRAINMKGTYDFYLHDQGGPKTVGRIVVQ